MLSGVTLWYQFQHTTPPNVHTLHTNPTPGQSDDPWHMPGTVTMAEHRLDKTHYMTAISNSMGLCKKDVTPVR